MSCDLACQRMLRSKYRRSNAGCVAVLQVAVVNANAWQCRLTAFDCSMRIRSPSGCYTRATPRSVNCVSCSFVVVPLLLRWLTRRWPRLHSVSLLLCALVDTCGPTCCSSAAAFLRSYPGSSGRAYSTAGTPVPARRLCHSRPEASIRTSGSGRR